jgi:hypothetical protein
MRGFPEATAAGALDTGGMKVSYGVRWRAVGPQLTGRLSVGPSSVTLVAVDGEGVESRDVPFAEILELDEGESSLTLVLRDGERIEVETTVDRLILADLAGKVPISAQHEWHPGLGL